MKKEEMTDGIRRYANSINKLVRSILTHYREEDIHLFRVTVKKLRAFLRLVSPPQQPLRLPKRFRAFYHATGVIRNLQIQRAGLAELSAKDGQDAIETLLGSI